MSSGMPTASRVTFWFSLSKRREKRCCPFQSAQKTRALRVLKSRPRKYRQAGHMGLGDAEGDAWEMPVYQNVFCTTFLSLTLQVSFFCTRAHCWPASSDCVFRADYHPHPSTPTQVSQGYHSNTAFFPLRTIWGVRAATLIPALPLSGQCLIVGRDPGPVWETARLFLAFTQHIMSLSRPSTSSSWRVFSGPGDYFFPQVEINRLCRGLRSLPSVTGEALIPMALLLIGAIPTVNFHLPFQPWAIFAFVLWRFSAFSFESGYVPKII